MAEILFIVPTEEKDIRQEINGTLLLASILLKAGFDAQVLRFGQIQSFGGEYPAFIRDMTARILEENPRCISFYGLWPSYHIMLRIAREVKALRPDILTVFGGPQASATAEATMAGMPFVDCLCTGEGEQTVVPFFTALLRQEGRGLENVPGVYFRRGGEVCRCAAENPLCALDALPHWDERLYQEGWIPKNGASDTFYMPLEAGRGCPYSCTFCCTSNFWRRTYRLKSPGRILEDMRRMNQRFGIHSFSFSHDAFTVDQDRVSQVCDRILEEMPEARWSCATRMDCISKDLILKMKRSGMNAIEAGVETGSPRMQKVIRKNLDLNKVREMVEFMLKSGLRVDLFFMYGFPEETEEDLRQTLDMIFEMLDRGVQGVAFSFCSFAPATAMTEKYYDRLVFEPEMRIQFRHFYGDEQDVEMIRQNKAVFPMYYDLPTPLRREYQYLRYLPDLYGRLRRSMKLLRQYYGDDLRMYRDFETYNRQLLDQGIAAVEAVLRKAPLTLAENMLRGLEPELARRFLGLMRFEQDLNLLRRAREDQQIRRVYEFNYIDFSQKKPVADYHPGSTEILLSRTGGKLDLQVLRFLL